MTHGACHFKQLRRWSLGELYFAFTKSGMDKKKEVEDILIMSVMVALCPLCLKHFVNCFKYTCHLKLF